jgi:RNA polymerase sigma factor (sigma-70 family)
MKEHEHNIWQELYSYESDIYGFIKNAVGDGDIARDLYQDVYLSVLQNISSLDKNRSLKNWLYTVTRNRVINYLRLRKRREFKEFDDLSLKNSIYETGDFALIKEVLTKIPPRQRQILLLREIEGWSYEDLAQKSNLTVSAVTSLLKRARESFQKYYILEFLPDWFSRVAQTIGLEDLFRFINPFNPPLNLLELINNKSSAYFSEIKAGWDQIRKDFVDEEDLITIWQHIDLDKNLFALDCGSGTGFISIALALQGLPVFALDIQQEMIHELDQKKEKIGLTQLKIVKGDLQYIPFRKNSFNLIFFVFVLHHIPDPLDVIKNCLLLLKAGGSIVIIDFQRHKNKKIADSMHDLWLGFQTGTLKKFASANKLTLKTEGEFKKKLSLKSFYQIWQKK